MVGARLRATTGASAVPGLRVGPFLQGNFTKPLIDRDGNVVRRYVSAGAPEKNREYLGSWLAA